MKKILTILLWFQLLFFNQTNAADAMKTAPSLSSSTETSLSINWEKMTWAKWYYVYYSTSSNSNYKAFWELYETNTATIDNLSPNTQYYVVISYLDSTNNESAYWPEWAFKTKWTSTTSNSSTSATNDKFIINTVKVINFNEIELSFNSEVDTTDSAIREFKITKNDIEDAKVTSIKVNNNDKKKLNLVLDKNLNPWEHKVIVLYLTDSLWRNIENWINWEARFVVPESIDTTAINVDNKDYTDLWAPTNNSTQDTTNDTPTQVIPQTPEVTNEPTPNTNTNTTVTSTTSRWWPSWQDVDPDTFWWGWKTIVWLDSSAETVAKESEKLPQAWPEHWLLAFIALILWFIFIKFKQKVL